jgi:hypothetical protein
MSNSKSSQAVVSNNGTSPWLLADGNGEVRLEITSNGWTGSKAVTIDSARETSAPHKDPNPVTVSLVKFSE